MDTARALERVSGAEARRWFVGRGVNAYVNAYQSGYLPVNAYGRLRVYAGKGTLKYLFTIENVFV